MNRKDTYARPVIFGRWPSRAETQRDIAARILKTLSSVESALGLKMDWAVDVGGDAEFDFLPFPTDKEPESVNLEPFAKLDDVNKVWTKGGLAVLLYGRMDGLPEGGLVSVIGTVGATTRRGNSLKIAFLAEDASEVPASVSLTALVEAVGEIWEADWFAALSDEIVEKVDRHADEAGIGLVTYWADSLQPSLPSLPSFAEVSVRKTSTGTLAVVRDLDSERAIAYARKVYSARS